ncbi:MAG: MauE/DoxX family redox-associated membrane protein [Acidobacteriota bacterium]
MRGEARGGENREPGSPGSRAERPRGARRPRYSAVNWLGKRRARNILRAVIALILFVTAVGKFLDVPGFAKVLGTYRAFPDALLLPLAALIPAAELALAVWLIVGRRPFDAAVAALAMHIAYAGWSALAILRGLHLANCGCFGVFWPRPLGWSTVVEDLVLSVLCGALVLLTPRSAGMDPA